MEVLLRAKEQKQLDLDTIEKLGIPSLVLMERAALAVTEEMISCGLDLGKVLVVCGAGNNGGDGFAAARMLDELGIPVTVAFVGREGSMSEETAIQRHICENCGIKISSNFMDDEYTTIVDAIFGIGLSREVTGRYGEIIDWINKQESSVVSVDIPSGIHADTGRVMGKAVQADLTVTFAYRKPGQLLYPGAGYCKKLVCRNIGILTKRLSHGEPVLFTYGPDDLKRIPERPAYSNKGTFGKVLLIAGSQGMSGAACLCGKASYRTGSGLVRILTPECNRQVVQTLIPEAIVSTWEQQCGEDVSFTDMLNWADVAAVGPGLGKSPEAKAILRNVLRDFHKPLVVDADALNLISEDSSLFEKRESPVIFTPHVGELIRLTKMKKEEILQDIVTAAKEAAEKYGVICVLKDARTVVSDGRKAYLNESGNNGMAAGGSGDVLTGVIAGLLAQGMEPFDAASFGVYIHGLAGDDAQKLYGTYGMMAGELADHIGYVMKRI